MSKEDIIRFNVGGTPYEVALATLQKSPETMLAKLASKKWRERSGNDADEPIFIDRDGEIFKYILAWYRNNVIIIPRTIPVGAVENEVKFFSLPDTVVVEQEKTPISESYREVKGHKKDCLKNLEIVSQERRTDLFATWAVQNAIQKAHLEDVPIDLHHEEYSRFTLDMSVSAALVKAKEKIKELGFESICSVEIVYYHNKIKGYQCENLKFKFK
jgi:hypothetical protein